jgi:hypothetical protein
MNVQIEDALRYALLPAKARQQYKEQMEKLIKEMEKQMTPKIVWRAFPLKKTEKGYLLEGTGIVLEGKTAEKMLAGCHGAVLFGATIGMSFDRWLDRLQMQSPDLALLADGAGSAGVEALCDEAEEQIARAFEGMHLTDRFSCGYGDLPLSLQRDIGKVLDLQHKAGIYVLDSCMMQPVKSVTAIVGISKEKQPARIRGCAYCSMNQTCRLKKEGKHCE